MNMNYKEKFEEFLSKMQRLIDNAKKQGHIIVRVEDLENAFPELKESEDERIRKALVEHIKGIYKGSCTEEMRKERDMFLAWLEKQDSHYTFEIKKGHWYKCVCDYMLNNSDLIFKNNRLYYCRSDWRLGGEIDERNVKDIGVNGYKSFFRPATNQEIKDWLEKQSEQKTDDKVEPKFHEGDWIIYRDEGCTEILRISTVTKTHYICIDISDDYCRNLNINFIDNHNYHLWTIQDAKAGDVLAVDPIEGYHSPFVAIYKKQNEEDFDSYCSIGFDGKFYKGENGHSTEEIHPATKEQSELLFAKMKEEGYEWNAEKKKLEKIIDKKQIKKNLQDNSFRRMFEQNPAWSEEDEKMLNNVIYIVKYKHYIVGVPNEEIIAWLKSLRPQNRWKPNEEQIKAFEFMIQSWGESGTLSPYDGTMNYLLSLLNDLKKL